MTDSYNILTTQHFLLTEKPGHVRYWALSDSGQAHSIFFSFTALQPVRS